MALIDCPECKKQISDQAPVCPHCGYAQKPITIEKTSKSWKVVQLVAGFMFIVGLISLSDKSLKDFSWYMIIVGFILGTVGRIGAWWSNR
jgi:hypothetical protein